MTLTSELQAVLASTRGLLAAAACSCALADDDGTSLTFVAADGAGAAEIVGVTLPVSRGIVGYVALSGQPIAVADVHRDERFARDVAETTAYLPSTILAVPMLDDDGDVMGVIEVLDPAHGEQESRLGGQHGTVAELGVLTVIASQAAAVVRLSRGATPGDDALGAALSGLDPTSTRQVAALLRAVVDRVEREA